MEYHVDVWYCYAQAKFGAKINVVQIFNTFSEAEAFYRAHLHLFPPDMFFFV